MYQAVQFLMHMCMLLSSKEMKVNLNIECKKESNYFGVSLQIMSDNIQARVALKEANVINGGIHGRAGPTMFKYVNHQSQSVEVNANHERIIGS